MNNYYEIGVRVRPLRWVEFRPLDDPYSDTRLIAKTPFGRFVIAWSAWQENSRKCIEETPWGDDPGHYCWTELRLAKTRCEQMYHKRLRDCLELPNGEN